MTASLHNPFRDDRVLVKRNKAFTTRRLLLAGALQIFSVLVTCERFRMRPEVSQLA